MKIFVWRKEWPKFRAALHFGGVSHDFSVDGQEIDAKIPAVLRTNQNNCMRIKTVGWLLTLMLWLVVSSPAFGVIAEGFVTPDPKTNVGTENISIEYFSQVSPGMPVAAPSAVPEPAGVALVSLGCLLLVARRRR